jgi:NADH-quinone oxidoreductase subunit L
MGLIGVILTVAAFMTAYYMGRMMLYTFFGPNRTGETESRHLHEVGWTMTVPLVVLALLSLAGGWLNIEPEVPIVNWFTSVAIGGPAALHHWLHPSIAGAEAVYAANSVAIAEAHHAAWPIILAIVVGLAGLLLAVVVLKPALLGTAEEEPSYRGTFGRLLYHKWYVDELYDAVVVRPVQGLSHAFYGIVDRGLIDGIVDGSGRLTQGIGLMIGRVQTGQVNTYAFMILVGVLAVLGAFVAL